MTLAEKWNTVEEALDNAVSIAWDGCHKIYILLDEEQHQLMVEYNYDPLLRLGRIGRDKALEKLKDWYESSCSLRFISSVRTVAGDPNEGFMHLIAQFEDDDEGDDEFYA